MPHESQISNELQEPMTFGKYKGQTKQFVIEENPQYLCWAAENVENFKISKDLLEEAEQMSVYRSEMDVIKEEADLVMTHGVTYHDVMWGSD